MPAYEPVSCALTHPFTARCSVCGSRGHEAHTLATGHAPWTYIGDCCQDGDTRRRVRDGVFAQWVSLSDSQKRAVRAAMGSYTIDIISQRFAREQMVRARAAAVTAPDLGGVPS